MAWTNTNSQDLVDNINSMFEWLGYKTTIELKDLELWTEPQQRKLIYLINQYTLTGTDKTNLGNQFLQMMPLNIKLC